MKILIVISIALSFLGFRIGHAQEVISSGGGGGDYIISPNGYLTFTVGEPISETFQGTTGILSQGFQQPDSMKIPGIGVKELSGFISSISAIPNPAKKFIILKVTPLSINTLFYYLYDSKGETLLKGQILNENTEIFLDHLSPSSYYLKVTANQKTVKILTIVKQP